MFSTSAFAQAAQGAPGGGFDFASLLPLLLIFVLFYFLLIRPQQKKMKQHKDMIAAVKRGDSVVTGGGIRGKVVKVAEDEALVEIAENVRVRVIKATITDVTSKAEPFKEKDEAEETPAKDEKKEEKKDEAKPTGEVKGG
ncbi:MAG: preprotein translocase subunit YajC [Alphaproteobacteria bacterium]|nr:preprotein translocase subunit YajC [Alphaproteobacteria bacterium]